MSTERLLSITLLSNLLKMSVCTKHDSHGSLLKSGAEDLVQAQTIVSGVLISADNQSL